MKTGSYWRSSWWARRSVRWVASRCSNSRAVPHSSLTSLSSHASRPTIYRTTQPTTSRKSETDLCRRKSWLPRKLTRSLSTSARCRSRSLCSFPTLGTHRLWIRSVRLSKWSKIWLFSTSLSRHSKWSSTRCCKGCRKWVPQTATLRATSTQVWAWWIKVERICEGC